MLTHLGPLSTAEAHAADDCSDAGSNEDEAWRRLNKIMYYLFVCCSSNRKPKISLVSYFPVSTMTLDILQRFILLLRYIFVCHK